MKTQYRIVAATKWWHNSNYQIEKRCLLWPFWIEATDSSYATIEVAKAVIETLKTDIRI